mmetsp:Transcript_4789/g.17394  ORF Transcript_4789/g.17394 Transcript_4789/m.17394 type:complete len:249 (+) Transcript_4789:908-1654(+)
MSSSASLSTPAAFVSVSDASTAPPYTAILAFSTCFTAPCASRSTTTPLTTCESPMVAPTSFATRTLSTLIEGRLGGIVDTQASATSGASRSSWPHSLAASTAFSGTISWSTERTSSTERHTLASISSIAFLVAVLYPLTISDGCTPMRSSSCAWCSSSPASVTTKFVPSPTSLSCILAAIVTILAAGCATSSSVVIVAASDVTNSFSRWLITSLFMPFGPRLVRVMSARSLHAATFLRMASSSPEKCW